MTYITEQEVAEGTTAICESCGDVIVYCIASTGNEFHPPYWRFEWWHMDKAINPRQCYQPIRYAAPATQDAGSSDA